MSTSMRDLHERLLAGDLGAGEALAALLLPILQRRLRHTRIGRFAPPDLITNAAEDAIIEYLACPQRIDLTRGVPLDRCLEARRLREERFTEEWGSYAADVFEALGALRDVRAASLLAANLDLGNTTTRAAAALGAPVIPFVLPQLRAESAPMRNGAVRTLCQVLAGPTAAGLTPLDRVRIKDALLLATGDENRFVRASVVDALSLIAGDDVTRALRRIADSDPYSVDSPSGLQMRYPIREQALRYLASRKNPGAAGAVVAEEPSGPASHP
jgi:hypothetical protein